MSDIKIHILDHKSLIRLNDAIDYCGDSLLKLLPKVDNYFKANIQAFEQQRDLLQKQLDKAEDALRETERNAKSSDCNSVKSAKKYRDICKEKVEKANKIISDCKSAYESEYKHVGGIITPHGAEKTLECLAKTHTDEATRKLDDIITDVEAYLDIPREEISEEEGVPHDQQQKFNEASERIKDMQRSDSHSHNVADATVETCCAGCKRPIPICTCPRTRDRGR